jgi:hypothetical protein
MRYSISRHEKTAKQQLVPHHDTKIYVNGPFIVNLQLIPILLLRNHQPDHHQYNDQKINGIRPKLKKLKNFENLLSQAMHIMISITT